MYSQEVVTRLTFDQAQRKHIRRSFPKHHAARLGVWLLPAAQASSRDTMATQELETNKQAGGTSRTLVSTNATQHHSRQVAVGLGQDSPTTTTTTEQPTPTHPTATASSHLAAAKQGDKPVPPSSDLSVDSEGELEVEEDDILGVHVERDEVGKLLRTTVSELEAALQV